MNDYTKCTKCSKLVLKLYTVLMKSLPFGGHVIQVGSSINVPCYTVFVIFCSCSVLTIIFASEITILFIYRIIRYISAKIKRTNN